MALDKRHLPLAFPAVLAALLVLISLPSLVAALIATSSVTTIDHVRRQIPTIPDDLAKAARANALAARMFEAGRYNSDAAAALMAMPPRDQAATGLNAEQIVRAALSASPASPWNWNRLAALLYVKGDRAGAYNAWQMSVLTGRYVPGLMGGRLLLAFRMFPITDATTLDLLEDQVRLTMDVAPRELGFAAYKSSLGRLYVRSVLWKEPATAKAFEAAYLEARWIDLTRNKP